MSKGLVERALKAINSALLTFNYYKNTGSPVYADKPEEVYKSIQGFIIKILGSIKH